MSIWTHVAGVIRLDFINPEDLFYLLAKGWWELDADFNREYQKVAEGMMLL